MMKGVTNLTIFIWTEASKEPSTLSPPTLFLSGKLSEHKSVHKKVKRNRFLRRQDLKSIIAIIGHFINIFLHMNNPKLKNTLLVYKITFLPLGSV